MNKKGFTLIELLAVIVILAIITAIAVPQILNVINGSKQSAWKDNVVLVKKAVEIDYSANSLTAATSSTNCTSANLQNKLKVVAKLDVSSTTVSNVSYSGSTCTFRLNPTGQFGNAGNTYATLACTNGKCTITY